MLNKICTDFETSKRLKELRIEGETFFYWWFFDYDKNWHLKSKDQYINPKHLKNQVKAYTLEQVLYILPHDYPIDGDSEITITANRLKKIASMALVELKEGDNLATVAAKLLIKLKEDEVI